MTSVQAVEAAVHSDKLPLREKIGYAFGDVGFNFLFDMGQLYLLKFMTDQMGLNPAVGGTVFLVAKVWDAFADMAVGSWIDNSKHNGRWGRYHSFIMFATIPLALALIANFHVPGFGITGRTVWAYGLYMVFGTIYSLANVPYGAMIPTLTKDPQERSVLSSFRTAGSNLGLLIATVAFMPIVNAVGNRQRGFTIAVCIFAVLGCIFVFTMCAMVRERYTPPPPAQQVGVERMSIARQFALVFRNRPLVALCAANLFLFSASNVKLATQVYFADNILHNKWALSYLGLFSIGCVFPGVALTPYLTRRWGKRNTYMLGCAIWLVADALAFFFVHNTLTLVIFSCFSYFGQSFPNTLNWAMVADCVEYGEWNNTVRNEGLTYSSFTWFRKVSQALAGFIPGVVLAWTGYQAKATTQSDATKLGIRGLMFGYPALMTILTIVVVLVIYNLTEKRFEEISVEMAERKSALQAQE